MMQPANLVIGDRAWLLPAGCLVAAALLAIWWCYRRQPASLSLRALAAALKFLGLAILAACLVNPLWSGTRARPGANLFAIVADNSQSMQIAGGNSDISRGEKYRRLLEQEQSPWYVRLNQDFEVRRYTFDSRLQGVETFAPLLFDGQRSRLFSAMRTLVDRWRGRPVAGVLLFTDGNATDSFDDESNAIGRAAVLGNFPPIYPVIDRRNAGPRKDIAVKRVSVTQTAFEDAPITIQADVTTLGYENSAIVAELLDEDGHSLDRQTQTAQANDTPLTFRFCHRPPKPGLFFYRLRASARQDLDSGKVGETSPEATFANNTYPLVVEHDNTKQRILYVSGRPNWEFKFLRRALDEDRQIDLVGLIRIAKREPKFQFLGRTGESTNPLYRGYKRESDAETERYDEPVLVRMNTRDDAELRGGFPQTEETLFEYQAIIIDDLEAEFFTHDQMSLINRFVSVRGGGLMMLGGQESLQNGGYEHTPLAEVLPVYLDSLPPRNAKGEYRLKLTRDGWLQPWIRLRDNELDERKRLQDMPGFKSVNRLRSLKPGAMAIANLVDGTGQTFEGLVVQRFGSGRCAVMTIGDLWRWHLKRPKETDADHDKACRQLLRWLVADVPQRIGVNVQIQDDLSVPSVKLQVSVRDAAFKPLENGMVRLTIHPPQEAPVEIAAEPSLVEPGVYDAFFVPKQAGAFRVSATVKDARGEPLGQRETGWVNSPADQEFASVTLNEALLEKLARETGGRVVYLDELDEFSKRLSQMNVPITDEWTVPLWHNSWVFLALAACFVIEWGLRRRNGLP